MQQRYHHRLLAGKLAVGLRQILALGLQFTEANTHRTFRTISCLSITALHPPIFIAWRDEAHTAEVWQGWVDLHKVRRRNVNGPQLR
jgi:hypothetical protein